MNWSQLLRNLKSDDVTERYRAANLLEGAPKTLEVLEGLAHALADDGFYETPGDYDAPPFHYAVARAATDALKCPEAAQVRELVTEIAARSDTAAFYAPEVLAFCGELAALEPALTDPRKDVREQAVRALKPMAGRAGAPAVLRALLVALTDDPVTWVAVNELQYFLPQHPELHPEAPDLVPRLVERLHREPGACTFFRAAAFLYGPEVHRAWVELALKGSHCAAEQLLSRTLAPDEQARLAAEAPLTNKEVLLLLGALGVPEAVPRLLPLLDDPKLREFALGAILRTPGGPRQVRDRLVTFFLELADRRAGIVQKHPDPAALAAEVLPTIRPRLPGDRDRRRDAWQMLRALGPLAASEAPAVLPYVRLGHEYADRFLALDTLLALGPELPESQDALVKLLDDFELAHYALQKVIELGPRAAALRPYLEVLALESKRHGDLIAEALRSVGPGVV